MNHGDEYGLNLRKALRKLQNNLLVCQGRRDKLEERNAALKLAVLGFEKEAKILLDEKVALERRNVELEAINAKLERKYDKLYLRYKKVVENKYDTKK